MEPMGVKFHWARSGTPFEDCIREGKDELCLDGPSSSTATATDGSSDGSGSTTVSETQTQDTTGQAPPSQSSTPERSITGSVPTQTPPSTLPTGTQTSAGGVPSGTAWTTPSVSAILTAIGLPTTSMAMSTSVEMPNVSNSPAVSPVSVSGSSPITAPQLPTRSNGPLQDPSATTTRGAPLAAPSADHRRSLPTAALAGAAVAAVLATAAVAAALVRHWARRRRRHARVARALPELPTPSTPSTTDHARGSASARVLPKRAVGNGVLRQDQESHTRSQTQSLVSESLTGTGSSRAAQDGSAATLELDGPGTHLYGQPPASTAVPVDRKGAERHLPAPVPPALAEGPRLVTVPQGTTEAQLEPEAGMGEAPPGMGERLLYFALPWAVGQRMLAMMHMEGQYARDVDSDGEEPLPAYEPRGGE
ncbi:hypothetical protein TRAPUB_12208 [Trametes pubescens]|uniref:Uncharacterized protein n=1 Tax=Trametes pubescens TaxID=154538 RepID=A0A1M2VUI6_TRAPU|nr:hypothetical protein TRAPUB_12208 [Trametes pubescens]